MVFNLFPDFPTYLTSCKRWLVAITSSFVLSIIFTATSCPVLTLRASLTTAKCPLPSVRPRWYSPLRSERPGLLLGTICPSWAEESMFKTESGWIDDWRLEEGLDRRTWEMENGCVKVSGLEVGCAGLSLLGSCLAGQRKDNTMSQNPSADDAPKGTALT